jgi:AraC-like DNA-binding protein
MAFVFAERLSDSPLVSSIWRTESGDVDRFLSMAGTHWEIVVMRRHGKSTVTLRGPETFASHADCPDEGEFIGIAFKLGTFMPHLPTARLVDAPLDLPEARQGTFRLDGSSWEAPTFENADTFIDALVRQGLLAREPVVDGMMEGKLHDVSTRSVQRRFLHATGLTHRNVCQIERARNATALLRQGLSIAETVHQAGYADQSHLTRALRRFIGQTPAQIIKSPMPTSGP